MFGSYAGTDPRFPQPGTVAFRGELADIGRGLDGGREGCNLLQTYNFYIDRTAFWDRYLADLQQVRDETGVDLRTLVNVRWPLPDTNRDGRLSYRELESFEALLDRLLAGPDTDRIGGWYLADEPTRQGYDPLAIGRLYETIKARDSRPVYICDQRIRIPDYARYRCDVLMIDYYDYIVNRSDSLTLQAWNAPLRQARRDLAAAGREETPVHAVLILGKPFGITASHEITHAAIRRVLDLGFDGIWFYGWRTSLRPEQHALQRWTDREWYAEAVETELHDTDDLVAALSRDGGHGDVLIRTAVPGGVLSRSDFRPGAPESGFAAGGRRTVALAAGDLAGDPGKDSAYYLHTRSTSDGDDELVAAFHSRNSRARPLLRMFGDGSEHRDSTMGERGGEVTALASGDFDGDGDHELVTAVRTGDLCRVYIGDTGFPADQHLLWEGRHRRVTALATGAFLDDDPGRDLLVLAVSDDSGRSNALWLADPGKRKPLDRRTIWSGGTPVTALAAGNFSGPAGPRDQLAAVFADTLLCVSDIGRGESPAARPTRSGPRRITALAAGDFTDDCRRNHFLAAAEENLLGGSDLCVFDFSGERPAIRSLVSLGRDRITALASGSFRESGHAGRAR